MPSTYLVRTAMISLALTLALAAGVRILHAQATPPRPRGGFSVSYAIRKRVAITRHGALVATLEVPGGLQQGAYLSLYPAQRPDLPPSGSQATRFEFHGNVEIRMRPRSDVDADESKDADVMMQRAPVVLTADDVDVVLEQP